MDATGFWLWAERMAVLLAGLASLLAVGLALWGIRLGRNERTARERSEASTVLSTAYLMRRRMEGWWKTGIVAEKEWPASVDFDRWLRSITMDVGLADRLLERSAGVRLEVANHAELVWRYIEYLQIALGSAARASQRYEERGGGMADHFKREWPKYRKPIAESVEGVLIALDRLDSVFPDHARNVKGAGGVDHLVQLDAEIRREAVARARRLMAAGGNGEHERSV